MIYRRNGIKKVLMASFSFLSLFMAGNAVSEAMPLIVGTTEHEALLAKEVGGDFIEVRWIVGADMNPQLMEPDPSFVPLLKKADLLLVNGQGLEAGWLDILIKEVRNQKMMPGQERYIPLSDGVTLLPFTVEELQGSRFQGILAEGGVKQISGNHHYWLDPENSIPMIQNIKKALIRIDPDHSASYEKNSSELISKLTVKMKEWDAAMAPYKGKKIISYHRGWTYLAKRHGLEIVSYIEPREMDRPKSEMFKDLASRFKGQDISLILLSGTERPPFVDVDRVNDLGVKLHAHTLILPESMNPSERRGDLISYFNDIYKALTALLK